MIGLRMGKHDCYKVYSRVVDGTGDRTYLRLWRIEMKPWLFAVVLAVLMLGCAVTQADITLAPESTTVPIGGKVTITSSTVSQGTYAWSILSAPVGSTKAPGMAVPGNITADFVPDVPGEFVLALSFTGLKETVTRRSTITAVSNSYLGSWTNSSGTFTDFSFGFGNVFTAKRSGIPYSGTWAMRGSTMTATAGGTDFAFTYSGGLVYSGTSYTLSP